MLYGIDCNSAFSSCKDKITSVSEFYVVQIYAYAKCKYTMMSILSCQTNIANIN